MGKRGFIVLLLFIFTLSFAFALDDYQTKKVNEQFTFCQVCADATYINLSSIETPNSTVFVGSSMQAQGSGEFCYNYTPTQIGRYDFRGISDGCYKTFATYIDVTRNGTQNPDGMPIFQGILSLIIFGISWFMLILSFKVNETGPKIFFMVLSLVFVLATAMNLYQTSVDFNVSESISETTGAIVFVIATVLFIIFMYLLIRQTITILDMYKIKRGLAPGASVTGYRQDNFMY